MKKVITCILTIFVLSIPSVYAGGGHNHGSTTQPRLPIEKEQAIQTASNVVSVFVTKKMLESSWNEVKPAAANKRDRQYGPEWVVSFKNPNIEDQTKQTLYVFLSIDGQYLGADYSDN